MRKLKILNVLVFVMVLFFTACKSDDDGNTNTNGNNGNSGITNELDLGATITRDFLGVITEEDETPISGVSVTIGSKSAVTDDNGVFIINQASVYEKQAYIKADKAGFLRGLKSVIPTSGVNNVRLILVPKTVVATINSGEESNVSLTNGAKVTFDGAFKKEDGSSYSGSVAVSMYSLEASNPNIEEIMPGNLQAQNEDEDEVVLESYGMLNVELTGSGGEKLNIAEGHIAEIEVPVAAAQLSTAPATIPLWHFDEDLGYWVEDGEATLVGGKYVGEVSHFSWWNCDAQFPTVTLELTLVDNANNPLSNIKVNLLRNNATFPRTGFSDGNGFITGLIPANETLALTAYDQCGATIYTNTIGPFSTNTNLGNIVLAATTITNISGTLVDCSSANVTDGYVLLQYGTKQVTQGVTNGNFNFNLVTCPSITNFTLKGTDYTNLQITTPLTFTVATPSTTVGNIMACTAVTEFVSVQIDNNPVDYLLESLAGSYNNSYFNIGASSSNQNVLYFGGNYNVGTYSITSMNNFWIEEFGILDFNYSQPVNFTLTINAIGAVGQYMDITLTGTYSDNTNTVRNLTVIAHILRDN